MMVVQLIIIVSFYINAFIWKYGVSDILPLLTIPNLPVVNNNNSLQNKAIVQLLIIRLVQRVLEYNKYLE